MEKRTTIWIAACAALVTGTMLGAAAAQKAPMRMVLVGQALIDYDIRRYRPDSFHEMKKVLPAADVAFTNLEVPIQLGEHVKPVKTGVAAHGAPPAVLDVLKELRFNLLSLSNNHSWDFGEPGILDTIAEAKKRGFVHAGTGRTLEEASAAVFLDTPAGRVALVAMASGSLDENAPAGPAKPGVNELKLVDEKWDARDRERNLAAIRRARTQAAHVIAYQHHHYWMRDDLEVTPPWLHEWARATIDAGATVFVAHGVPILHGIEIYKGRPIFYSLGNFIFHSRQIGRWPANAWRSVIADLRFQGTELAGVTLTPILLNEQGQEGELFNQTRGAPRLAPPDEASAILARLANISRPLGTTLQISDNKALIRLTP